MFKPKTSAISLVNGCWIKCDIKVQTKPYYNGLAVKELLQLTSSIANGYVSSFNTTMTQFAKKIYIGNKNQYTQENQN